MPSFQKAFKKIIKAIKHKTPKRKKPAKESQGGEIDIQQHVANTIHPIATSDRTCRSRNYADSHETYLDEAHDEQLSESIEESPTYENSPQSISSSAREETPIDRTSPVGIRKTLKEKQTLPDAKRNPGSDKNFLHENEIHCTPCDVLVTNVDTLTGDELNMRQHVAITTPPISGALSEGIALCRSFPSFTETSLDEKAPTYENNPRSRGLSYFAREETPIDNTTSSSSEVMEQPANQNIPQRPLSEHINFAGIEETNNETAPLTVNPTNATSYFGTTFRLLLLPVTQRITLQCMRGSNRTGKTRLRNTMSMGERLCLFLLLFTMPVSSLPQPPGYHALDASALCIPTISDSTPDRNEFRQIECEISRCHKVSKIIFEKTGVHSARKWTPVFEGINKTSYKPLDTGNNYTLDRRIDYTAFHTKHLLYIRPLELEDQGEWRCVVYDDNTECPSRALNINTYVTPEKDAISINPSTPKIVSGEYVEFTCKVEGIHPEPEVVWRVNGMEYTSGIAINMQRENRLWYVKNIIKLGFDESGIYVLSCVMKTKTRKVWLHKDTNIHVKEPAKILEPKEDINIAANMNVTFNLLCSGSGHNPIVSWQKDGDYIPEYDARYEMIRKCDTERCTGSIAPKYKDPQNACLHIAEYAGVYSCVVSLKPPYNSLQVSPDMNVYIPHNLCNGGYTRLVIGIAILTLACVVLMGITVSVCIYFRVKTANYTQTETSEKP